MIAFGATSASAQPSPAPATGSLNIAFDQIDRTIRGAGQPPPLNTFSQDVAAIEAFQSASIFPSEQDIQKELAMSLAEQALSFVPFASAAAQAAMAAQQMAMQRRMEQSVKEMESENPGTYTRFFFYRGWSRVEERGFVLIVRPDRHQQIYLNPMKKTYHTEDISPETPAPAAEPMETVPPNPAKVDANVVTTPVDTTTIAGETAAGYQSEATTTLTGGIDPCVDGTYKATQLTYFAQGTEPLAGTIADARDFFALTLPQDCYIMLAPQHTGPTVPYRQMYVYRLVKVVRDAALAAQPTPKPGKATQEANMMQNLFGGGGGHGANYMQLSERANIRQLTDADAPLFDIPPGYTQAP
ncbi:MAG: hypothetical protein JOZ91_05615 [Candidatus Eremiobacteraeota bacterium]|nr:hypothetical protein [Candidatus Eremiobacteraeota bacterium]